MSESERAELLREQAIFILYPGRGQAQITPGEWLELCDELLEDPQGLGLLEGALKQFRPRIEKKAEIAA